MVQSGKRVLVAKENANGIVGGALRQVGQRCDTEAFAERPVLFQKLFGALVSVSRNVKDVALPT